MAARGSIRRRQNWIGRALEASPFCEYCGRKVHRHEGGAPLPFDAATVDHKIPRCQIAPGVGQKNFALACYACNQDKGSMSEDAFRAVLAGRAAQVALAFELRNAQSVAPYQEDETT